MWTSPESCEFWLSPTFIISFLHCLSLKFCRTGCFCEKLIPDIIVKGYKQYSLTVDQNANRHLIACAQRWWSFYAPGDLTLTKNGASALSQTLRLRLCLFNFVLVSAVGMFPPPRPVLLAGEPRQRRISFADSPRCCGSTDRLPHTCGWTDRPRTAPGNNPGMKPAPFSGHCPETADSLSA